MRLHTQRSVSVYPLHYHSSQGYQSLTLQLPQFSWPMTLDPARPHSQDSRRKEPRMAQLSKLQGSERGSFRLACAPRLSLEPCQTSPDSRHRHMSRFALPITHLERKYDVRRALRINLRVQLGLSKWKTERLFKCFISDVTRQRIRRGWGRRIQVGG